MLRYKPRVNCGFKVNASFTTRPLWRRFKALEIAANRNAFAICKLLGIKHDFLNLALAENAGEDELPAALTSTLFRGLRGEDELYCFFFNSSGENNEKNKKFICKIN